MANPSSYFDKTWIRPSNMLTFFSDECKDNLSCGCGNKENKNNSNDEIQNLKSLADNNEDINNEIRGRAHTATEEDASLFTTENSLLSRRMSRSLSPSFWSHQSDQYDGCGAAAAAAAYVAFPRFACHEDGLLSNDGVAAASNDNEDGNVENGHIHYQPYYSPQDFTSQTWLTAISETISIQALAGGATFVLGAVVIVHPLVLVGAATAAATAAVGASVMYAVGLLCDIDKGYAIWAGEDFGSLFWNDAPNSLGRQLLEMGTAVTGITNIGVGGEDVTPMVAIATVGSREIIEKDEEHLRRVFLLEQKTREQMQQLTVSHDGGMQQDKQVAAILQSSDEQEQRAAAAVVEKKKRDKWNKRPDFMKRKSRKSNASATLVSPPPQTTEPSPSIELRRRHSAPATPSPIKVSLDQLLNKSTQGKTYTETVPQVQPSTAQPLTTEQLLSRHFPPLEHLIVQDVYFPNLHTAEFFRIFFADDAPFCMKDFQLKRGDVDVVYGKWTQPSNRNEMGVSFKDGCDLASVASESVRERTMTFNTLTKSYFGPAYAKAIKIQRAVQLSDNLLVIENQTQLADIPFADRFRVVERWIVEAVKNDTSSQSNNNEASAEDMALSSKLTVYAEVLMLRSCSWEAQIQKKASETFNDLVTDWVKTATKALKATEEQKRLRLGLSPSDSKSSKSRQAPLDECISSSTTEQGSELIAQHRRNFQELDKRIKNGDLEWCSIEVMHSSKAGKHSAFAQVLESHTKEFGTGLSKSSTQETDVTSTDGGLPILAKRRSRNFLRLLSSRKGRSSNSAAKTR